MLIEAITILNREFEYLADDLRAKHIELGMKASGNWVNNLIVDVTTVGKTLFEAKIIGPAYTQQLINGRKPGKQPPIEAIEDWIRSKSAFNRIENDIALRSIAFAIARTIAEKGTKYYQKGGTELLDAVVTTDRILRIINLVGGAMIDEVVGELRTNMQSIADGN